MPALAPPEPRTTRRHADDNLADDDLDWPDVGNFDPPDDDDDDDDSGGDDGGEGEPVRWVTVATFWHPAPAHIARLHLESHDVPCVIVDENLVATDWLYANAVGGIKLQVPESDVAEARDLLGAGGNSHDEPADPPGTCPRCGSNAPTRPRLSRAALLVSVLLLCLPLPSILSRRCCGACGFEWTHDE